MSDILELRQRVEAAEQKFGVEAEQQTKYSGRLITLVGAIETAVQKSRDEHEKTRMYLLAAEAQNEQLRGMLHTLLMAVEKGRDQIGPVLRDIENTIAALSPGATPPPAEEPAPAAPRGPVPSAETFAETVAEEPEGPAPSAETAAEIVVEEPELPEPDMAEEPAPELAAEPETAAAEAADLPGEAGEHLMAEEPDPALEADAVDAGLEEEPAGEMEALDAAAPDAAEAIEADPAEGRDLNASEEAAELDAALDAMPEPETALDDAALEDLLGEEEEPDLDASTGEAPLEDALDDLGALDDIDETDAADEMGALDEMGDLEADAAPEEDEVAGEEVLLDADALPDLAAEAEAGTDEDTDPDMPASEPEAALEADEVEALLAEEESDEALEAGDLLDEMPEGPVPEDGESDLPDMEIAFEDAIEAPAAPDLVASVEEDEMELLASAAEPEPIDPMPEPESDEMAEGEALMLDEPAGGPSLQAMAEQLRQKNQTMANGADHATDGG